MKVLFIYSNHATYLSPHYNHGIGFLAAVLKKAGHDAALLAYDRPVERDRLAADVRAANADLIGFSVSTNQYKYAKKYSSWLKQDLGVPTIVGGVHAMLDPEGVFEHADWDYLVVGEGEDAIVDLAEALDKKGDPSKIANVWSRRGGQIVRNEIRPLVENLDSLPFPDREIFDMEHLLEGDRKVLSFLAGRGCPYGCTYCSNHAFRNLYKDKGKWVRLRSPQNLMNEIRFVLKTLSPKIIDFNDDIFTLRHEWTKEFLAAYRAEIKLPFRCNVRVETVDREMLADLKRSGCDAIRVGVEHGDEAFRKKILKRNMPNERLISVFDWAHELDLKTWSFNMLGFPDETPALAQTTIDLNKRLRPDHLQISIFNPYPGTELLTECKEKGYLPEGAEAKDGYFVPDTPLVLPTMSNDELKSLHRKFINLSSSIKDGIRIEEKYKGRKIFYKLSEMLPEADIKQPAAGYVKIDFFTMDEDSRLTLQEHPDSSVAFRLRIPDGAVFEAAIAIHPEVWEKAEGEGVVFEIYATTKKILGGGRRKPIFEKRLDPRKNKDDRCWIEIAADLREFAGKEISLELVTRMHNNSKSDFNTAGWGDPVIVEAT